MRQVAELREEKRGAFYFNFNIYYIFEQSQSPYYMII